MNVHCQRLNICKQNFTNEIIKSFEHYLLQTSTQGTLSPSHNHIYKILQIHLQKAFSLENQSQVF